ncbi:MAG: hypothetical protein ACR2JB_19695 [Bryobacteraceae bacterium]
MALPDFLNVIQQYSGASASSPRASTHEDFSKVAETVPQSHLAGGLAEAFRSDQTPPFAEMIGNLFRQSNGQQRAGILTQLLSSSGGGNPLSGLGEHFSGLLKPGSQITPQQAEQIPPEAVQQLAEHAQKNNPSILDQASNFYAQHPQLVQGLGAGALTLIMSHMSKRP